MTANTWKHKVGNNANIANLACVFVKKTRLLKPAL